VVVGTCWYQVEPGIIILGMTVYQNVNVAAIPKYILKTTVPNSGTPVRFSSECSQKVILEVLEIKEETGDDDDPLCVISGTIYYGASAGMTDDRPPIIRQKAGATRWDTETIINYDFFPKGWIDGPVGPTLVYFKETQTPADSWNEGPGKLANDPDKIASGAAAPGQVHFFPAVCNAQQIRDEFAKRNCRKI
jgi:hypothetical protein